MKISQFTNNQVQLQGRIAEVKEYSPGKVANVTVVVDNGKDKDGNERQDYFIRTKSFSPNTYNMLKKGMLVRVYGHIAPDKYEKDGKTVYETDIIADYIDFLESKSTVEAREMNKSI